MTDVATKSEVEGGLLSHTTENAADRAGTQSGTRSWLRTFVWLVVIAAAAGGAYLWWRASASSARADASAKPAARAVPVVTAMVRQGDLPIYIDGLGTVNAFNTVTLHTRVDGELVKVHFTEGQTVREGDLLAELDPRPFQVQLEQAEGQLARDGALLRNAKLDLTRYQEAREAIPQQQVDTAAANVAQYEGAVKVDQSQIDNAKLQLAYCRITSPLDGTIGLRLVDQGNTVHANDATGIAVITQLEPIAAQFSIPQDDLPKVQHAMAAGELVAEAYDRDAKTRLATGKLAAIDNQINASTGTVRLKAVFDNKDRALFPNQFVNVRLLVDTRKAAVLIPVAAVQRAPEMTFVYVVKPDESVEVRAVSLGSAEGDTIVVTKGLAAGETVVTDGVDKLQAGTKVTSRTSTAASGGGDAAQDKTSKDQRASSKPSGEGPDAKARKTDADPHAKPKASEQDPQGKSKSEREPR